VRIDLLDFIVTKSERQACKPIFLTSLEFGGSKKRSSARCIPTLLVKKTDLVGVIQSKFLSSCDAICRPREAPLAGAVGRSGV